LTVKFIKKIFIDEYLIINNSSKILIFQHIFLIFVSVTNFTHQFLLRVSIYYNIALYGIASMRRNKIKQLSLLY